MLVTLHFILIKTLIIIFIWVDVPKLPEHLSLVASFYDDFEQYLETENWPLMDRTRRSRTFFISSLDTFFLAEELIHNAKINWPQCPCL
jgi:hypothetical protein